MPRSSWQEEEPPLPGYAEHVRDNVIGRDLLNPHHNFESQVLDRLARIEQLLSTINLRLAGRP